MDKILVKHTCIELHNYALGECPVLEKTFSIWDPITYTNYYKGIIYDKDKKILKLPRGLDVYYIEKVCGLNATLDKECDPMETIDLIKIKYKPKDDIQLETLKFMLGKGEYNYTKSKSQLSVNLSTGKGKSYCSIATACYTRLRSIIITSYKNWLEQWKQYILEYTDTKPREICYLNGAASINRLFTKDMSQYKFILASHSTIKSYANTYGWDKITELFKYMKIGIKIYDEAHLNFDNMCNIEYYTNTYKTYYVTATPIRSSEEENTIYQLAFKNVPSISLYNEDKDPHTKYRALLYNSHPTVLQKDYCKNKYGLDRNKYVSYIIENEQFYKMLHVVINLALSVKGKVLMYIGTNLGILKVKEWIETNYPILRNNVGVYTSLISENKEVQLENKIILSTTKSCGAAMDIKMLKMTVVLAEPFKSDVLAIQTIGRTRDSDTYYIEVVDVGFRKIKYYYDYKKPTFLKYALNCKEVRLSDKELSNQVDNIIKCNSTKKYNVITKPILNRYSETRRIFNKNNKLKKIFNRVRYDL